MFVNISNTVQEGLTRSVETWAVSLSLPKSHNGFRLS